MIPWSKNVNERAATALRMLAKKLDSYPPTLATGRVTVSIAIEPTGQVDMKLEADVTDTDLKAFGVGPERDVEHDDNFRRSE
jgi:hypothetical protein